MNRLLTYEVWLANSEIYIPFILMIIFLFVSITIIIKRHKEKAYYNKVIREVAFENVLYNSISKEIVAYAVNPVTHELITMNETLSKDFEGGICYEVLQGRNQMCQFCPEGKIKNGETYQWAFYNNKTNKLYVLFDKMVPFNGSGKIIHLEFGFEISKKLVTQLKVLSDKYHE